jgi:hypothetical protein
VYSPGVQTALSLAQVASRAKYNHSSQTMQNYEPNVSALELRLVVAIEKRLMKCSTSVGSISKRNCAGNRW